MNKKKRNVIILLVIFAIITPLIVLLIMHTRNNYDENLILHHRFDERNGREASDSTGNLPDATVFYVLSNGSFQPPIDPQWRENGVMGGALQFDGYSNFIRHHFDDIAIAGPGLTISMWVAPRAFEWLGTDPRNIRLTALVSQHAQSDNEGFVLGIGRHGDWSFQVGLGDRWITIWDENHPLEVYEWTHIAAVFDGDGGEISLYKNGERINSRQIFEGARIRRALATPLTIGRNSVSNTIGPFTQNMFTGLMDELRIYDAALSSDRIRASFERGLTNGQIPEVVFDDIWFDTQLLVNDIHRPVFHITAAQHWMNEPHAPFYFNGKYHLFYQFNPFGPYWQQIHWGHWVSEDMIRWRNVREALRPLRDSVSPDGVWSGTSAIRRDGTPVLLFTAGDDLRRFNPISNQNVGLAFPADLNDPYLIDWVMHDDLVIRQGIGQGAAGEFRDPHVWREGDTWFLAIGSSSTIYSTGAILLYTTEDDSFKNWTYRGSILDWDAPPAIFGTTWELPVLLPIRYWDGRESGRYFFCMSPAPADRSDNEVFYWIGDFCKETFRFIPDHVEPKLIDFGNNVFTGPTGFIDPHSGHVHVFSIIQDQRTGNEHFNSGWAHVAGLPRVLKLCENHELMVFITPNIENIIGNTLLEAENISLSEANALLSGVRGDVLRLIVTVENISASRFGAFIRQTPCRSEQTMLFFDAANERLGVNTGGSSLRQNVSGVFTGDFSMEGNTLTMEIYIDRSVITGVFNNRNTVSARVYPTLPDADGLELFADGGDIHIVSILVQEVRSIYE